MSLPDGRHFKYTDATCKDGTPYPEEWLDRWLLVLGLADDCRDEWGGPLEPVSWYRSPAYNQGLINGGSHQVASASQHPEGNAVDLRPIGGGDASMLYRKLMGAHDAGRLQTLGGIGLYPTSNWVHVDTSKAPDGHLRRWLGV